MAITKTAQSRSRKKQTLRARRVRVKRALVFLSRLLLNIYKKYLRLPEVRIVGKPCRVDAIREVTGDLLCASSLAAFRMTAKNLARIKSERPSTLTTTIESQGKMIEMRTNTVMTLKKN